MNYIRLIAILIACNMAANTYAAMATQDSSQPGGWGSVNGEITGSSDEGEHWTEALPTNIPDARVKQSAGNLPDGTAYLAGNPTGSKRRVPLALLLSSDGICFDCGYLLRTAANLPPQRYPGRYKTLDYSYPKSMIFKNHLYVAYSTNKECVECTILDLNQRKRLQ